MLSHEKQATGAPARHYIVSFNDIFSSSYEPSLG
jgi:hypothetical protein